MGLESNHSKKNYEYDKRGNVIQVCEGDDLCQSYEYNALNRLEATCDKEGREVLYRYNGLGQRVARNEEEYLIDLTRSYHNLLQVKTDNNKQTFYWDTGVTAVEENEKPPRYYLADEMGSPLRVLYGSGKGEICGYDEFGNDLYEYKKEIYAMQDMEQPFGYTGYRYDNISDTLFAQEREYQPLNGRFMSEDVIRRNGAVPSSLNKYGYCLNNPLQYIDLNGKEEKDYAVYYLNNMDGAKVFGHNSILIENPDGSSEFYSYMGTGAMPEVLKPSNNSLGYMGHELLNSTETEEFLKTGDINVTMADKSKNHDNYDRALKKNITEDERNQLIQAANQYIMIFDEGSIIEDDKIKKDYLKKTDKAAYNLYTYNCDTVAGEIIALIDPEFISCQYRMLNSTPNNSFYVRKTVLGDSWKEIEIGENDWKEILISHPGLYYIDFAFTKKIGLGAIEFPEFENKMECGTD